MSLNKYEMVWAVLSNAVVLFVATLLIIGGSPWWLTFPIGLVLASNAFLVIHLVARLGRVDRAS